SAGGTPPPGGSRQPPAEPDAAEGRRDSTIRNRPATKAASVRQALAAGFAPVAWKSENAADWLIQMLPVKFAARFTPASAATSSAGRRTSSEGGEPRRGWGGVLGGRVDRGGDGAPRARGATQDLEAVLGRVGRHDERDRAEPFLA